MIPVCYYLRLTSRELEVGSMLGKYGLLEWHVVSRHAIRSKSRTFLKAMYKQYFYLSGGGKHATGV